MFIGFFVLFIGTLAEGNRMPFDLPEAESELVSGYNTEYSGFRFLLFFLAEFSNLYLIGAIAAILFLGGWQAGPLPGAAIALFGAKAGGWGAVFITNIIQLLVFQAKTLTLVFVIIQVRWTLPRVRVDQLMGLCWKYLVPVSFVNLVAMTLWMILIPANVTNIVAILMTVFGASILMYYFYRIYWQLKTANMKLRFNPFS